MKHEDVIKQKRVECDIDTKTFNLEKLFEDLNRPFSLKNSIMSKINEYKRDWNGRLINPLKLNYIKRVGYSTYKDKFPLLELILYDIHYEIEHQVKTKIKHPYYDIKYGIENLIYFFKPIVKFRTFDHGYIIDVLYSVFKKFDSDWSDVDFYVGQENDKVIIKSIVKLLSDIRDDNFGGDYDGKQEGLRYKILFNLLENNIRKFWW